MGFSLLGLLLLSPARRPTAASSSAAALIGRRLVRVPPREPRASPARPRAGGTGCPIDVPGRRQFRPGHRPAAGGLHHRAARAGERRLVLGRGARRDGRAVVGRALVRGPARGLPSGRAGRARPMRLSAPPGRLRGRDPRAAGLLEELLHGELHVLLHVLPDRAVPGLGAGFADLPVRVHRLRSRPASSSAARSATASAASP